MKRFYSSLVFASTTFVLVAACSEDPATSTSNGSSSSGDVPPDELVVGGDRPVTVHVPAGLDPEKPAPLVILLHGFGVSGLVQEFVFQLEPESDKRGFLYAHPDGTPDQEGQRFWNATDACCDFYGAGVDDVAYLAGLVEEIGKTHAVDPKRVYFLGHSNGGFMSHRMACDRADVVAAVASLAGAVWKDPAKCNPSEPIAVLQIHGTADETVSYAGGGDLGAVFPGAVETTETWAAKNGCALMPTAGTPMDIDATIAGDETKVARYDSGCKAGGAAELWTIEGAGHVPGLGENFAPSVVDWLFAHAKP